MLQFARGQRIVQQIKDRRAEILRRRHAIGEQRIEIQVGVVETIQHLRSATVLSSCHQINDHSRLRIDRAAHQNLNEIIVAVTVLVVAFSVRRAVLFRRERRQCAAGGLR